MELAVDDRRPELLKISLRETLAQQDWTPKMWIEWLQEANLATWVDTYGDTPLTALLKRERVEDQQSRLSELISELVRLGVDVNMHDRKGNTVLTTAGARDSLSCVEALLEAGANVNSKNYRGRNIISIASLRMRMAKQEGKTLCYAMLKF